MPDHPIENRSGDETNSPVIGLYIALRRPSSFTYLAILGGVAEAGSWSTFMLLAAVRGHLCSPVGDVGECPVLQKDCHNGSCAGEENSEGCTNLIPSPSSQLASFPASFPGSTPLQATKSGVEVWEQG